MKIKTPVPTDAAVKAWAEHHVRLATSGSLVAKKKLREHVRHCGHFGGIKTLNLERAMRYFNR